VFQLKHPTHLESIAGDECLITLNFRQSKFENYQPDNIWVLESG